MKRRALFARLGAVAVAAALAPAVQAEASLACHQCGTDAQFPHVYGHDGERAALSDARAEGYRAGWDTATLRAESRAQRGYDIIIS